MALELPTLLQRYRVDASGATAGMSQIEGSSSRVSGSMGVMGSAVKGAVVAFAAFEGVKFLKDVVGDAEQVNQAIKTTTALFGSSSDQIVAWSQTTATSLGLSQKSTLTMADSLGTMLKGFGLATPAAASMSEQLIKTSVDVAAFKNADPTAVLSGFQRGLTGAARGLKQYGIDTSTAAQGQAALSLGIQGTAKDWTAAEKAQVFYQLILRGTSQETGTFAARSHTLTEEQRILSAQFSNLKDEIGQGVLPVVTQFFGVMTRGFSALGPEGIHTVASLSLVTIGFATLLTGARAVVGIVGAVRGALAAQAAASAAAAGGLTAEAAAAQANAAALAEAAAAAATEAEAGGFVGLQARATAASLALEAEAAQADAAAMAEAGVASTEAAGGLGLMSITAAGAIPVYVALGVAIYELGRTIYDLGAGSTKASLNVKESTDKVAQSLIGQAGSAQQAEAALGGLGDTMKTWAESQGAAIEQLGFAGVALDGNKFKYQEMADAVLGGRDAINHYIDGLHLTDTNAATLHGSLTKLHESLAEQARDLLTNEKASGALNGTLVDTAVRMSTAKNGTVDWLNALDLVALKQQDVAAKSGSLLLQLETQKTKWDELTTAIILNTDALRGNEEGFLGIQGSAIQAKQNVLQVHDAYVTWQNDLKNHAPAEQTTKDFLSFQSAVNSSKLSLDTATDSAEKFAADSSGVTAATKALNDARKKGDPAAIAAAEDTLSNATAKQRQIIEEAAAQIDGPFHDALVTWLNDTANVDSTAKSTAHSIEVQTQKHLDLSGALADQSLIEKTAGLGSEAYAAATQTVTEKQQAYRQALINAAAAASGPVKKALEDYISLIGGIPVAKTTKLIADEKAAKADLARFHDSLFAFPHDYPVAVSILMSDVSKGNLAAIRAVLNVMPSAISLQAKVAAGGKLAAGGPAEAGKTYTVGEAGTELLTMFPGGGGYVTSHPDLVAQIPRAASFSDRGGQLPAPVSAAPSVVHNEFNYDVDVAAREHVLTERGLMDELREMERHGANPAGTPRTVRGAVAL